jgi:hypothetical protein
MIVWSDQLDPHDRRFDTADDQKYERVKDVEDSQPLMVTVIAQSWSRSLMLCDPGAATLSASVPDAMDLPLYRSVSRYAVSSSKSCSFSFIAGISEPGFTESGFWIHTFRFSGVFGAAPDAIVSRLIK